MLPTSSPSASANSNAGSNSIKLDTAAIITTTANALLAPLHDRMPVVVSPDGWDDWLGENSKTEGAVKTLLRPYPGQAMAFWAVDRRVSTVRNDSPDLFAPLSGAQNRP